MHVANARRIVSHPAIIAWAVGILCACGVSSSKMRRADTTHLYSSPYETVFNVGLAIVREQGWTLENANKEIGFIVAKSGTSWKTLAGQTVSIQLTKTIDGRTEVVVSARMNQSGIQVVGWGESEDFVRKVVAAFDAKLRPQ